MVQLTRIYTRGGDDGKTSLGDGSRIPKSALRIHAMGDVDEANSWLGFTRLHIQDQGHIEMIAQLQNDLFDAGADLCWPKDPEGITPLRITGKQVERLESQIDNLNRELDPLQSFVLPGGSPASASLHVARTIIRRAERNVCELKETEPLNPHLLHFMNRLSDFLFVFARYLNSKGKEDILWIPGKNIGSSSEHEPGKDTKKQ